MKILLSGDQIVGLALDAYSGPMEYVTASEDFDESKIDQYKVVDGKVVVCIDRVKKLRQEAYREEADPLFFKVQRQEATQEEWAAKINEIRSRYPYPTE
jgi:hypothetical protein